MTLLKTSQKRDGSRERKVCRSEPRWCNNNNTYGIFRRQKARRDLIAKKKNTRIRTNNKKNGNNKPELAYEDEAYVMYVTSRRLSGAARKRMQSITATKPRIVQATSSAGVCSDGLVLCRSAHTSEGQRGSTTTGSSRFCFIAEISPKREILKMKN
jgi:hypothetical protein